MAAPSDEICSVLNTANEKHIGYGLVLHRRGGLTDERAKREQRIQRRLDIGGLSHMPRLATRSKWVCCRSVADLSVVLIAELPTGDSGWWSWSAFHGGRLWRRSASKLDAVLRC